MKVYLEPDDLDVRIEIVPLIDVIFCILVFFILGAVTFARMEGLNVDLPQAGTAKTQFGDTLPVEVDALGQIKVRNTTISESQLTQLLAAYVGQNPEGIVVLQADKLVSYGQVARLIDTLQKVGGTRVALGATMQAPVPQPGGTFPGESLPTLPNQLQPDLNRPAGSPYVPTVPAPLPNSAPNSVPNSSNASPLQNFNSSDGLNPQPSNPSPSTAQPNPRP
ncbi:biopolymer transporter ExbD [Altericista sp. CCNU0014]|uniref:ExbD/TolR family protein n=1 Tax=Altericista sp. CCNU0014 TaxID=3082949 RepID=UPI00384B3E31